MVALVIVKMHPGLHASFQMRKVKRLSQLYVLPFQAAPKPLVKGIVNPPAFTIHADAHFGTLEDICPGITHKLAALIRGASPGKGNEKGIGQTGVGPIIVSAQCRE